MTLRLLAAVSGHGFGHLAQVAPVLNELRRRLPDLYLIVQCALPEAVLRSRIRGEFEHVPENADIGMIMASSVDVLAGESLAAYRAFHAGWPVRLERQQALLRRYAPDLVLADIPYLPLAAAASLGIPALALCSLHWAAILRGYFPEDPEVGALCAAMIEAYSSAEVFLCPAPSMPMPELTNTRAIGPIAAIGRSRREELNRRLDLAGGESLVLVALGGIDMPLPMERWPRFENVRWLIPAAWDVQRPDAFPREALADISFTDLLCSCDVLLTKPGYGSFTEAVCNGKPVLYVERGDWPEEPSLVGWLHASGNALRVERERLEAGEFEEGLQVLLDKPAKPVLVPSGIGEAAEELRRRLG